MSAGVETTQTPLKCLQGSEGARSMGAQDTVCAQALRPAPRTVRVDNNQRRRKLGAWTLGVGVSVMREQEAG